MKQFAKSLVSVVIALSILATMCIVGFSAVAGTPTTEDKTFVMIPETGTKAVEDMHKTHVKNATGDFSVVDASTLTGGDTGLAAGTKAYKANLTTGKAKDGFWVYTKDTDFGDFYYNTTDNYLDAWIYVSDISKMNNIIIRFYVSIAEDFTAYASGGGSYAENYIYQVSGSAIGLKTGWTHVQFQMNTANSWQNSATWDPLFAGNGGKVVGVGIHDHSGANGDYTLAVAGMKVTNKTNLGDKTDKDYLLTATAKENGKLAASGTLGSDTYNGGTRGAYAQTGVVMVQKLFPAKDLSADGTKVSIWMHVADVNVAGDVTVELGATPNNDKAELQYAIKKADLKQGWNEYVIDTGKVVNGAYLNNICRLRIFNTYVAEAGIKIGEVYATHPTTAPAKPSTYKFMANNSTETTTTGTWDTANKKEGAASIALSNTANGTLTSEVKLAKIDVNDNWVGYFWLYVDDPSVVNELFWELSSAHGASNNAVRYLQQAGKNQLTYLKAGWNKVEFKLHTTLDLEPNSKATDKSNAFADNYTYYRGGGMHGTLNLDAINYIRVAVNFAKAGSVKINAFTLCEPSTLLPTDKDYIVSDSKYEEMLVGDYEAATYDEGTGAFTNATPTDGAIKVRAQKAFEAKDLTDKYITTWIYVDDPSKIDYIEYEVTSSGKPDVEETAFVVNASANTGVLKAGWNKVILNPHSNSATESNMIAKKGTLDVTKANFIRIHTKGVVDFKLGATYVSDIPTQNEEKDSYTVFVDHETETTVSAGTWDTADKKEGKASYKMNSNAASASSLTISAEQGWKGYLWVYMEDVTKVAELFWEISSDNDCKGACVRYIKRQASGNMADLKNGWNKIEFELHDSTNLKTSYDDAVSKSFSDNYYYYLGGGMTGNVDWANIDYVRVIAQPTGGGTTVKVNAFTLYKPVVEPEKDENKVGTTILSANKDKDIANVTSTTGADIGITVVESSTLKGGVKGVPAKEAYKVPLKAKKVGIVVPVENPDWSEASDKDLNGYAVNAWVWISDASKVSNLVMRYFEEGKRNGVDGWTYQWNSGFKTNTPLQTGWNNVNFIFPGGSADYNHKTNNNSDGHNIVEFTIHDHGDTPDYELAIACARLVKVTDDISGGWVATGDAFNVAMIVVAVLLAAMAASVTVYFGKKAR